MAHVSDGMAEALGLVALQREVAQGGASEELLQGYLEDVLQEGMKGAILASAVASVTFALAALVHGGDVGKDTWSDAIHEVASRVNTPVEMAALESFKDRIGHITGSVTLEDYLRSLRLVVEAHGAIALISSLVLQADAVLQFFEVKGALSSQEALMHMGMVLGKRDAELGR